ncbi:MAG: stage V sporulation protein AC [Oscillospiraceae bacterium]
MRPNAEQYEEIYRGYMPKSNIVKDCAAAFAIGGAICVLGQALLEWYKWAGAGKETAGTLVSATLIALSGLLTGFGLYDKIARFAGAGTLVPITGFANSVVSPAIEFKTEGWILGVGAKMFIIAGPVVVYGTAASALAGMIYMLIGKG